MTFIKTICVIILSLFQIFYSTANESKNWLNWSELPALPDSLGLGGAFIGEHNGVLMVAGGSNFSSSMWDGGEKHFHKDIYVLEKKDNQYQWHHMGNLPFPIAHGAAVSTPDGVLCMGGTNGNEFVDIVFKISWDNEERKIIIRENFPALPEPCSFLSATIMGDKVYVAGGRGRKEKANGMKNFWVLQLENDYSSKSNQWQILPPWSGVGRYGAVLQAQSNGETQCLYLISGKNEQKNYLRETWVYKPHENDPNSRWSQKEKLPRAAMGAPSTIFGQSHILVLSGSDGHDINRLHEIKDAYEFPKSVLAYHTITDTWITAGEMPQGLVTSSVINWDDKWIIPTGEVSPGNRTSKVFAFIPGGIASSSPFHWIDFVTLIIYLLIITGMGFYFSRSKSNDTKKFFLAGGRIPFWAAGLSIMATSVSSIGFMATPAKSFATNWAYFVGTLSMLVVIPIVVWAFIPFFKKLRVVSAYEYLEARFNTTIRFIAALLYCIFQVAGRMAVVLYLPGVALAAVTGLDIYLAILLMGFISTLYTVMGGMEAVVWTDVIQGFVLIGGALLCIYTAIFSLDGGFSGFLTIATSESKFDLGNLNMDYATASLWVVLIGNIFYRLSTFSSDQSIVQRYMSTSDEKQAKRASWMSLWTLLPWSIIVFSLGTALYVFYKEHPSDLNPIVDTDGILPLFIAQNTPIGLSGLIIAGIFAATMSSLDSAMHSTSTVVVTDFYKRFFPNAPEKRQLQLAKWLIVAFGFFGTCISLLMVSQNVISIWDVFIQYTGLFGGIIAGVFILGIFTDKANGYGALVGVVSSIILMFFIKQFTDIHLLLYGAIGLSSCFTIGYLSSFFSSKNKNVNGLTIFTIENEIK